MNDSPKGFGLRSESGSKSTVYADLADQIDALLTGEPDVIANLANAAAVIYHGLPTVNWVGFYLARSQELVLGPFQGKPACVRIPIGKGVCGTSAFKRESILVPDVHEFPGHIACDADSRWNSWFRSSEMIPYSVYWTWTARLHRASIRMIRLAVRLLWRSFFAIWVRSRLSNHNGRNTCSSITAHTP